MEVGAAWLRGEGMRIVGLRQHIGFEPIPAMLRAKKVVELNNFDQYLEELGRRLKEYYEKQHDR
jgi:hypothetical protein